MTIGGPSAFYLLLMILIMMMTSPVIIVGVMIGTANPADCLRGRCERWKDGSN